MADMNQQKYTARAFQYVNHQNGAALFFNVEGQLPPREWRARGSAIQRVTIEEVKSEDDLDGVGFRTLNTVIIELYRAAFRRLLESLQERDLRVAPIAFTFRVDQEGSLQDLFIDGEPIAPRVEPPADSAAPSDVAPKNAAAIGPGAVRRR